MTVDCCAYPHQCYSGDGQVYICNNHRAIESLQRELTQAQARCAEARNVALEEAAEACENHAIHVSNTEDAYAACVNCARDIRTLKT